MTKNTEYFKIPDSLPFRDQIYTSITGEVSSLHSIVRMPSHRNEGRIRRHAAAQWKPIDKANLVKIFDDADISLETKGRIQKLLALHLDEIDEYRRKLNIGGLPALEEQWTGSKMRAYPSQALEKHGLLFFNPLTGDVRYRKNFAILSETQSRIMSFFLQKSNTAISKREIEDAVKTSPIDSILLELRTKLSLLAGKPLIAAKRGGVFKFSPTGIQF